MASEAQKIGKDTLEKKAEMEREESAKERISLVKELMEKDNIGVNEANKIIDDFLSSMQESKNKNTDKELYEIMRKLISYADGK